MAIMDKKDMTKRPSRAKAYARSTNELMVRTPKAKKSGVMPKRPDMGINKPTGRTVMGKSVSPNKPMGKPSDQMSIGRPISGGKPMGKPSNKLAEMGKPMGMKKGGMCGYNAGGKVPARADGVAKKGRTKGKFI